MWKVKIGQKTFKCLRVMEGCDNEKELLYEAYLDIDRPGKSVLERRYNGSAWNHKSNSSSEKLKAKGCPAIKYNGTEFVLWYDIIPEHAI